MAFDPAVTRALEVAERVVVVHVAHGAGPRRLRAVVVHQPQAAAPHQVPEVRAPATEHFPRIEAMALAHGGDDWLHRCARSATCSARASGCADASRATGVHA